MTERVALLDVNVLVALLLDTHVHHRVAHAALAKMDSGWATCPTTESAAFRLLLNPRVAGRSITCVEVTAVLAGVRADPRWHFLAESASLVDSTLDTSVLVGHQQVTDFHLVDVAARHGATLATFDAGIAQGLAPPDRRHVTTLPQR